MGDIFHTLADTLPVWRIPVSVALAVLVWQIAEYIGSVFLDD